MFMNKSMSVVKRRETGCRRSALCPPVSPVTAAEHTRLSFDRDDASVHEHGVSDL